MKLIIDIPEEYQRLCPEYYQGDIVLSQILHAVKHGTPIPDNATVCDKYAEQEPCDDAVSRGVLEQIMWERDVAIEQLKELGYELGQKIEPCDDVVSRQTVLDYLKANVDDFPDYHEAIEKVLDLPSVRPQEQTGKWDEIVKEHKCYARDDTYTTTEYHCSECGAEPFTNEDGFYEFSNYCPNCGARMVEPQES